MRSHSTPCWSMMHQNQRTERRMRREAVGVDEVTAGGDAGVGVGEAGDSEIDLTRWRVVLLFCGVPTCVGACGSEEWIASASPAAATLSAQCIINKTGSVHCCLSHPSCCCYCNCRFFYSELSCVELLRFERATLHLGLRSIARGRSQAAASNDIALFIPPYSSSLVDSGAACPHSCCARRSC